MVRCCRAAPSRGHDALTSARGPTVARKTICYFSSDLIGPFGQSLLQSVQSRCGQYGSGLFVAHGGTLGFPWEWESNRNILYRWARGGPFDAFLVANILGRNA